MSSGIYLVRDDGRLVEMTEQAYGSVALLQELVEAHPSLLSGAREAASDWLAIVRQNAPGLEDDRGDRWSLDRVFLDRDGVPTLVEIAAASDRASERALLGQALEYAANLPFYWTVETMVAQFEANCRESDRDPEQVFEDFLGSDTDEERFWQQVKTNLQAGKVRIVFVSAAVSPELSRVVEFLNAQMDPAQMVAIEIKQYGSDEGFTTLVPRAIGRLADTSKKVAPTTIERRRWDADSFFAELGLRQDAETADLAYQIYEWCNHYPGVQVYWRTGDTYGGFVALCDVDRGETHELFKVGIDAYLEVLSSAYAAWYPFTQRSEWLDLRQRFSAIGLSLPDDPSERRSPNLNLATLDEASINKVIEVFGWAVDRTQQALEDTKRRTSGDRR